MFTPNTIRIQGMGAYLPPLISSDDLEHQYGIKAGWAKKYSGVLSRPRVTHETNGFMGARAAEEALRSAAMTLSDIDLILSASGTFDYPIPNQASIIKSEMTQGQSCDVPAIDIDSTCVSFVTALQVASSLLDGIALKNILIVSSEITSKGINPEDWETITLFGDAAVAAVVSFAPDSNSAFIKGGQKTYTEGTYLTIIEGGGNKYHFSEYPYDPELHSFKMSGRNLLKMAKKRIPEFMDWFFQDLSYSILDMDAIIPHQASKMGLRLFESLYPFKPCQVKKSLSQYGNCVAASIPLTFYNAVTNGEIKRGDVCLLCGTSAGFSISASLIIF